MRISHLFESPLGIHTLKHPEQRGLILRDKGGRQQLNLAKDGRDDHF